MEPLETSLLNNPVHQPESHVDSTKAGQEPKTLGKGIENGKDGVWTQDPTNGYIPNTVNYEFKGRTILVLKAKQN